MNFLDGKNEVFGVIVREGEEDVVTLFAFESDAQRYIDDSDERCLSDRAETIPVETLRHDAQAEGRAYTVNICGGITEQIAA